MNTRGLNDTMKGLWETHLFACSCLVFLLMMLADGVGYVITFGQRSGVELVARLGRGDETEEKK